MIFWEIGGLVCVAMAAFDRQNWFNWMTIGMLLFIAAEVREIRKGVKV